MLLTHFIEQTEDKKFKTDYNIQLGFRCGEFFHYEFIKTKILIYYGTAFFG